MSKKFSLLFIFSLIIVTISGFLFINNQVNSVSFPFLSCKITFSPAPIEVGEQTTVSWTSTNAVRAEYNCSGIISSSGPAPINGSMSYKFDKAGIQSCSLTVYDANNQSAKCGNFLVVAPKILGSSCTPPSVGCGDTNQWSCVNNICQLAKCGDGICNDCSFGAVSPCQPKETSFNCPSDCRESFSSPAPTSTSTSTSASASTSTSTITTSTLINLDLSSSTEVYSIPNLPIIINSKTTLTFTYSFIDLFYDNNNIYLVSVESKDYEARDSSKYESESVIRFFKSIDGGKNWIEKSKILDGEPQKIIRWVKIKKNQNAIYVLTPVGVFVSHNEGENWNAINLPPSTVETGLGAGSGSERQPAFDFLPLDDNNFIISYDKPIDDETAELIVSKTSNGGLTWEKISTIKIFTTPLYSYIHYGAPRLSLSKDGTLNLLYWRIGSAGDSTHRALFFKESKDKGRTWSEEQGVALATPCTRYNGESGIVMNRCYLFTVVQDNHQLFVSDDNNKTVFYSRQEYNGSVPINNIPYISQNNGGSYWDDRYIKTIDGLNLTTAYNTIFSAASSPNGKYLAILGEGLMVKEGYYFGASHNKIVDNGIFILYSQDYGKTWNYKKIAEVKAGGETPFDWYGVGRLVPDFQITDNGEILIAYPEYYRGSIPRNIKGKYSVKFIRGKIGENNKESFEFQSSLSSTSSLTQYSYQSKITYEEIKNKIDLILQKIKEIRNKIKEILPSS